MKKKFQSFNVRRYFKCCEVFETVTDILKITAVTININKSIHPEQESNSHS